MMRQIETWLSDSRVSNNVKYAVVYSLVDFFVMYMYFHFVQVVTPVSSAVSSNYRVHNFTDHGLNDSLVLITFYILRSR